MKTIHDFRPPKNNRKRPMKHLRLAADATRFDQRLTFLMDYYGISSKEVADAVYVSHSTIAGYTLGLRRPSLEIALMLAQFFDVSLDWLAGRTNNPQPCKMIGEEEQP